MNDFKDLFIDSHLSGKAMYHAERVSENPHRNKQTQISGVILTVKSPGAFGLFIRSHSHRTRFCVADAWQ